jgi:hypothetical protein
LIYGLVNYKSSRVSKFWRWCAKWKRNNLFRYTQLLKILNNYLYKTKKSNCRRNHQVYLWRPCPFTMVTKTIITDISRTRELNQY